MSYLPFRDRLNTFLIYDVYAAGCKSYTKHQRFKVTGICENDNMIVLFIKTHLNQPLALQFQGF